MLGIVSPTIQEELKSQVAVPFSTNIIIIIAPVTPDKILVSNGTINPPL